MSEKYLKSESRNLLEGLGTELCWGWSPAINFADYIDVFTASASTDSSPPERNQASSNSKPAPLSDLDACLAELGLADEALTKQAAVSVEGKPPPAEVVSETQPVRILLCGAADIRHVLSTLAAIKVQSAEVERKENGAPSKKARPIHFFMYEPNLRVHCRHLLFLQLLCDSTMTMAELEDKVAIWMELYANALLRDISAATLKVLASKAVRAWGYGEGPLAAYLDSTEIKSKEKDFIEEQMLHWSKDSSRFGVEAQWDTRVRNQLAERYDSKVNVIDWDFNFYLKDYNIQLKFPEYREWRLTGQGYDYARVNPRKGFLYDYTIPNKSLAHFNRNGVGQYLGDVKNGPFWAFGGDTENAAIVKPGFQGELKVSNGIIAMHNIRAWWYELLTGKRWPWADHKFAWDDPAYYNYLPPGTPSDVEHSVQLPEAKFHFIGLDFQRFLVRHQQQSRGLGGAESGQGVFDAVFVGSNATHVLQERVEQEGASSPTSAGAQAATTVYSLVKPGGKIFLETLKYVVDAQDEAKAAFTEKLLGMAKEHGWDLDITTTRDHHRRQVIAREEDQIRTEVHKKALQRSRMPHHLVLKETTTALAAATASQGSSSKQVGKK